MVSDYPLGVQILMLHVPAVLDYIHKVVDDMLKQKGRSKTLPIRVLNVLARYVRLIPIETYIFQYATLQE